jgi:hypothetical protein
LSLGANRTTILRRVIFPEILPAWLRGLALAPANPFVFKFLGSYNFFHARKTTARDAERCRRSSLQSLIHPGGGKMG